MFETVTAMVIPLRNYHRCCSGVPSTVVTRSMARKLETEMQIQDLTVGDETLVDVIPLSDLPDPLSESSASYGMPADVKEANSGKEKMQIQDLTMGNETLVDVAPLSDLPDPLSESSASFGMPADVEGDFS